MYLKNKKIGIVGGGLVGSLLSIYLSKQGAIVSVFDKREDIRLDTNTAGRSINLALSNRGINALNELGIAQHFLNVATPMYKRIMHAENGILTEQPYGKKHEAIFSISRYDLNTQLLELAEKFGVKLFFNHECVDIDFSITELKFKDGISNQFDYIFGTDGAGSVVRKKLANNIKTHIQFIDSGYKELTIPAHKDGTHKLANNALHIWPRKSFMVIALPNLDGTFTCTLFAPLKGLNSFDSLVNKSDVDNYFSKHFSDLKKLIPKLSNEYFSNPTSSLGFVRCSSWRNNNIFLLGDACHATVPFYGQGMNSGFEDCFLLNRWLNINHDLTHGDIDLFLEERKVDTTAMQDLSMHNFIEMQDKTANPQFLLQKKIEDWFSQKHPDKWTPLYSMVTFSNMRYSEAIKRGEVQNKIMESVMTKNNLLSDFDINELENLNIEQQILELLL